jgi:nucleoside-triphosphatase THEP1
MILATLWAWFEEHDGPKIYWMNGMAGTGKTTIAYTLCERLNAARQLGASFFCSRSLPDCRDARRIVPTIAYQLARFSRPFQAVLCQVLASEPDVGTYTISDQFETLLRKPLLEVNHTFPGDVVIVIDALDECTDAESAQLILNVLFRSVAELPIKFFVTCRPEPSVHEKLHSQDDRTRSVLHLHDVEESLVQADIETYLNAELASISPSPEQIQLLANRAGKLFIYAATAVRYIRPRGLKVDHRKRLKAMLAMTSGSQSKAHVEIDALYAVILEAAMDDTHLEPEEIENIRIVLRTVLCAREPLTTEALAALLRLENEDATRSSLEPLRSVLHVPERGGLVSTLHASFPDYMLSRERSGQFFCDLESHSELLSRRCFELMADSLSFNICNLESSYVLDEEVPDLSARIDEYISPQLFYACRYWSEHIEHTGISDELYSLVDSFLSRRLLFWVEVLNLKKCIGAGGLMLVQGYNWLKVSECFGNI